MTRPAQYLLMALAFDVYWTLVVMLRERGLLIWLTLALFAAAAAGGQPSARPAVGRGGLRHRRLLGAGGADRFSRRQPAAPVDGGPVADVRRRLTRLTRTTTLPGWVLAAAATVGGPVAYLLGARLGAMTLLVPMALAVAAMACGWLVLMLLFHLGMGRRK